MQNLRMIRRVRPDEMDRSFDVEYWQRQGLDAIFDAALELYALAYAQGEDPAQLRIERVLTRAPRN